MTKVRPWRQWTLRTRMVVATAALAAVGLILADVSGVALLRQYLVARVDNQLRPLANGLAVRGPTEPAPGRRANEFGPRSTTQFYSLTGLPMVSVAGGGGSGPVAAGVGLAPFAVLVQHADQGAFTLTGPDGSWRVQVRRLVNNDGYVAVGVSLADVDDTQFKLLLIDVSLTILVLAGLAVGAAALVRVGLRPLTRMAAAAAEIADGDLSRRVEDADAHTESGRLGRALNTMLVRIERAMAERTESEHRLRQFLADAAHELRTPLTSIQGFAELYRRGGAPQGPALDEAMAAIEDEVGRMRLLVNDLLLLARMDEERPLDRRPVDLLAVAADAVRDAHLRVPGRFVLLGPLEDDRPTFDPVTVVGDEARLRQVATNLVANALQHTPDDAEIVVRVGFALPAPSAAGGGRSELRPAASVGAGLPLGQPAAVLEVADTGPGMAPTDAERAFERLFRAEGSRSRRHGGAGLGLAIVSAIVQAHGGRVELFTAPMRGSRFRVLLPAVGPREDDPYVLDLDGLELSPTGPDAPLTGEDRARSEVSLS